ncbi:hypothetical protein BOX15_Mlig001327g1 [Macrostomum lignano]|uniref:Alpha-1,4-N-acetylglucosaminyltransferase n=1 Tax=Macrostomum lignano TaxID=282301 RepID=A0A267GFM1_9PLAT|nr:hypothetical protein BOX15_Mlig001327g1 [Macrostomum lignano]
MRLHMSRLLAASFLLTMLCFVWLFNTLHRPSDSSVVNGEKLVVAKAIEHIVRRTFVSLAPSPAVNRLEAAPTKTIMKTKTEDSSRSSAPVSSNRIPYILHQTWITDTIPATYVPFVKSWLPHNPPLDYYYWTDAKSVQFVAKHYPHLLAMFKGYKAHLNRADSIRYMLLHHYGGVYADMDMMRLRDLSPLLNSTQELCYLSQERYEITRLYWGLNSSVMNAIMLSSPGHQFMEFVVNSLPKYAHHSPNVMESTGPFFLQNVYNEFVRSPPCRLSEPRCRCAVADPYLFMPQIDPIRIPNFRAKCSSRGGLASNAREACSMLDKINWQNDIQVIGKNSYTHHGFLHYGFENQRLKFSSEADIGSVRQGKKIFGVDFY